MKIVRAYDSGALPEGVSFHIFGAALGGQSLLARLNNLGIEVAGFIDDVAATSPDGYALQTSQDFRAALTGPAHVLVPSRHFEAIASLFADLDVTVYDVMDLLVDGPLSGIDQLRKMAQTSGDPSLVLLQRLIEGIQGWVPAPRDIPSTMVPALTMDGRVPIVPYFRDDTCLAVEGEGGDARVRLNIDSMVYSRKRVDTLIHLACQGQTFHYGPTDTWLYQAFQRYPVTGKTVAVLGSASPVYEAICLAHRAAPLTVEYGPRLSDDSRLRFMTPQQFNEAELMVEAALSVSAFEHDGLGRYGDPLDADGDLKAMAALTRKVMSGGLLYLTVPLYHDTVLWNVNRQYGPLRLPLLLSPWTLVEVIGAPEGLFLSYEPLTIDAQAWKHFFESWSGEAPEWVMVLRNDKVPA